MHKTPLLFLATLLFSTHTTSLWAPLKQDPSSKEETGPLTTPTAPPPPSYDNITQANQQPASDQMPVIQRYTVQFDQLSKKQKREELHKKLIAKKAAEVNAEKDLQEVIKKLQKAKQALDNAQEESKAISKDITQLMPIWQRLLQWFPCTRQQASGR